MTLRQGCRRRNPWWCWSVLALVLAIALPGRALIAIDELSASADGPQTPRVERIERYYHVPNLIEKLADRHHNSAADTAKMLADRLAAPRISIEIEDDTTLRILASADAHHEIDSLLTAWLAAPFDQLIAEGRILKVPQTWFDAFFETDQRLRVLDEADTESFWNRVRENRAIDIVSEPKIRVFDRQTAQIEVGTEQAFIVSYEETAEGTGNPKHEKIRDGVQLELRPAIQADGAVDLTAAFQVTTITEVVKRITTVAGKERQIEFPQVSTVGGHSTAKVRADQTLILGIPVTVSEGKQKTAMVVALRLKPVIDDGEKNQGQAAAPPRAAKLNKADAILRIYAVADLLTPAPRMSSFVLTEAPSAPLATAAADSTPVPSGDDASQQAGAAIDFMRRPAFDPAPLQTLIETVVAPDSWQQKGGSGQIEFDQSTASIVVRQTAEVHQQIRALLSKLRREQDLQCALEIRLARLPNRNWWKQLNWPEDPNTLLEGMVLSPVRANQFRQLDEVQNQDLSRRCPKITLFNEQVLELLFSLNRAKSAQPLAVALGVVANDDRSGVRLNLTCNASNREEALTQAHSFRLLEGESLLIDLGREAALAEGIQGIPVLDNAPYINRLFRNAAAHTQHHDPVSSLLLLVTPRIIVMEEEQEVYPEPQRQRQR